jgi:hypothetical protein
MDNEKEKGEIMSETEENEKLTKVLMGALARQRFGSGTRIELHIEARDVAGNLIGPPQVKDADLATKQFAQLIQSNILGTAETITNTSGVGVAVSAFTTLANNLIIAGSGIAPPATPSVTDFYLAGPVTAGGGSSGQAPATVGTWGNTVPSSGVFQVTGTVTNNQGSNQPYSEVGIQVNRSVSPFDPFLLTHDNFSGVIVSPSGTLAVTYNIIDS